MTGLLIVAVYVLGWLLTIRGSLRRRMLTEVCRNCGRDWQAESCYSHRSDRPRGALRDRNGADVAVAVWAAAWWPIRLPFVAVYRTVAALGGGIKTVVLHATPLTPPEMERRLREQQSEIERLTSEMETPS